jgi:hypothetical protein
MKNTALAFNQKLDEEHACDLSRLPATCAPEEPQQAPDHDADYFQARNKIGRDLRRIHDLVFGRLAIGSREITRGDVLNLGYVASHLEASARFLEEEC